MKLSTAVGFLLIVVAPVATMLFTVEAKAAPIDDAVLLARPRYVESWVVDRKTAKTWVITDWLEEPSGIGCVGGDRPFWDNMVGGWYDSITDPGTYYEREFFRICATGHCGEYYGEGGEEGVTDRLRNDAFADVDVVSWGEDHLALDTSDAAMIGWHGNRYLRDGILTYSGVMNYEWGGGSCNILGLDMELGDTDLEFLHMSSCHSLSWSLWENWWRAFGGLHLLTGFHGTMWIREAYLDNYERFGDEAFVSSIADAWIDNLYDIDATETADQCPVVYGVGHSAEGFLTRVATERYNDVQGDPHSTDFWGAVWIGGCRGDGVGALPYLLIAFPVDPSSAESLPMPSVQQVQRASEETIRQLVEQTLPVWDERLLSPKYESDWTRDLDVSKIIHAMSGPNTPPASTADWNDQIAVALSDTAGRIYFTDRGRNWDVHRDAGQPAVDDKTALEAVLAAAEKLGLPMSEFAAARVDIQLAGVAPSQPQSNIPWVTHQMYRLVSIPRALEIENEMVPVEGSLLRAAVNRQAEIQRATTSFPPFAMARRLKLRKREAVVEQTVREIMQRHPEQDVELEAHLAYAVLDARRKDPRRVFHQPVVVVNVKTGLTPFSLSVPVAR